MSGGRVSEVEEEYSLNSLLEEMSAIDPDFQFEMLKVLEHLAMYNADLSYAIENIVTLGNTDYTIEFQDNIPDTQKKELLDLLKTSRNNWYSYSDGINSLVNDLFVQLSINGALSAEIVPTNSLDGIKKIVLVSPGKIRFQYDSQEDSYLPVQVSGKNSGKFIKLNPFTYKYYALRRFNQKPYGVPPFLSALENISIEKSMVEDLKYVTKKLGVLGFLKVLVNAPARKPGEDDAKWYSRCQQYLNEARPEVEKSAKNGFLLGFKGTHDVEMQNISGNVQGAKELFQLNTEMKMAGLKQDPMMLGRNYSTTETLGRVILTKLGSQVENYQKIVASFLEYTFRMELLLKGYNIDHLEVKFEKPLLGDRNKDEEAFSKKIDNADKLYKAGIINQLQRAQMLGYEEPDQEEPRAEVTPDTTDPNQDNPDNKKKVDPVSDNTEPTKESNWKDLLPTTQEFDYCLDNSCNCSEKKGISAYKNQSLSEIQKGEQNLSRITHNLTLNLVKSELNIEKLLLDYIDSIGVVYNKAIDTSITSMIEGLKTLGEGANLQEIQDKIIYTLYKDWNTRFTKNQIKVTKNQVEKIYQKVRTDKSIFQDQKAPNAVFNVTDYRTQDYYKRSDSLYLGQFITDEDTRKRITDFIKEEYIAKGIPTGTSKDPNTLKAFREKFTNVLQGEDWKVVRILNTTVAKLKNYAAVNYIHQAQITKFEIVGVPDRLQCTYCSQLQGAQFDVVKAVDKIEKVVSSEPDFVKSDAPFINAVFKRPEQLQGLSPEEIQAEGIDTPPYHPHCRDRVVAVFSEVVDNGSKSTIVNYFDKYSDNKDLKEQYEKNKDFIAEQFGREVSMNEFYLMAGGFPTENNKINYVKVGKFEGTGNLEVKIKSKDYDIHRVFLFNEKNLVNLSMDVKAKGQGIGTKLLNNSVQTLLDSKTLDRIQTEAAGAFEQKYNGYYTWAKLGYNHIDPEEFKDLVKDSPFKDTKDLTELIYKTEGGEKWWKENGETFQGQFDLKSNSRSVGILNKYIEMKSKLGQFAKNEIDDSELLEFTEELRKEIWNAIKNLK